MLELLIELFVQVLFEGLLDWLLGERRESLGREKHHPAAAMIGFLLLGGILGWLSVLVLPERILAPAPVHGLSLLLNPLAAGVAMHLWGRHREAGGHATSSLATWYGGGGLALGTSLVRFLGVP